MSLRVFSLSAVATISLAVTAAAAAAAADPPRDHDVTIDDYFGLAGIGDIAVSPDGGQVAYAERRWEPPRETQEADLWVVPFGGGTPRRLTFEPGVESSPRWSADGKFLYYRADRTREGEKGPPYHGKSQVWRLAVDTGVETPVTRTESGVDAFEVARDGGSIYFTVSKESHEDPWKPLQEKHGDLEYGHGKRKVSELWKLDVKTWRAEKLLDPGRYVHEFSVSPDGRRAALITAEDEELISLEGFSRVDVHDLAAGTSTTLDDELWRGQAPSPFGWLASPVWSDDGARLAFSVSFDGYSAELFVAQWGKAADPRVWRLERAGEVHPDDIQLQWDGDRDLLFVGHREARRRLYRIRDVDAGKQGETNEAVPGDVVVTGFDASAGRVAVVKADPTSLPDLFAVGDDGSLNRLTEVNPQARRWKLPRVSLVRWDAPDGTPVEGVLELPPDAKPDERLPLVLEIHGGPTSATPYGLFISPSGAGLFAARGYARLSPNYRGSLGYGDEFLRELVGRENDVEVKDLLAGVDALVSRGIADPDRLAVMGWSNGGFLTTAVVVADPRFKAASTGAGVVDQFLQWGLEDTPGHVINFMGGKLPWDAPQNYLAASPAYALGGVRTPTLIHVGADDQRVPAAHARALHRALRRYVGVPTQLVVYPGEGHGLDKLKNRRAKMEWDQAWLDRYTLGKEMPTGE